MIKNVKRGENCSKCGRRVSRYIATDAVVKDKGKYLLIKRAKWVKGPGLWAFPGGRLDWNETMDECVIRELKEETGYKGEIIRFLELRSDPERDVDNKQTVAGMYLCRLKSKVEDYKIQEEEIEKLDWFKYKDLPSNIGFDHRDVIDNVEAGVYREKGKIMVGVGIIVLRGKKVLLLKRRGSHGEGEWSLVGGSLCFGETLRETAYREVKEEVGLEIKKKKLRLVSLSEQKEYVNEFGKQFVSVVFVYKDDSKKKVKILEKDKSADIGWFDLNDLPKPFFKPSMEGILGYKDNKIDRLD